MAWNPLDDPIDHFLLAGKKSPGIAEILGLGSPRKWDIKKGYGTSGATTVYAGDDVAKFSAKIFLTTTADWDAWHAFAPLVEKAPDGSKPKALDIWHPQCEQKDIRSVVVEDVVGPSRDGDDGRWVVEIKFIQYRAPKPAMAKPKGSSSGGGGSGAKGSPEEDERDRLIRELTQQVKDLA